MPCHPHRHVEAFDFSKIQLKIKYDFCGNFPCGLFKGDQELQDHIFQQTKDPSNYY